MNMTFWRIKLPLLLGGLFACGLFACTTAVATPDTDRAALEAATHRWLTAVNAQDANTLNATMTEDVELMHDSTRVTGRDAAIQALRDVVKRGHLVATSREITIVDDVAWRVIGLAQTRKNRDVHSRGQALEIWQRVQGEWKLHRHMSAAIETEAISVERPATKEPVLDRPAN
jgi:ketosteroid isomerase-like protein